MFPTYYYSYYEFSYNAKGNWFDLFIISTVKRKTRFKWKLFGKVTKGVATGWPQGCCWIRWHERCLHRCHGSARVAAVCGNVLDIVQVDSLSASLDLCKHIQHIYITHMCYSSKIKPCHSHVCFGEQWWQAELGKKTLAMLYNQNWTRCRGLLLYKLK